MTAINTRTGKGDKGSGRRGSRGQILPVMLFGFFITLVSLVAVFNTSRVTIEKTQLVNAADAAAYSGAIQAARALNFYAYSSRAMVANTIATGYLVSYVSWMRYLGNFVNEVSKPRQFLVKVLKNTAESGEDSWNNVLDTIAGNPDSAQDRLNQGNGEGNMGNAAAQESPVGFLGIGAIKNAITETKKDKSKGPGEGIKAVAALFGLGVVRFDLLNWFYAATQVTTYGATPSVIDDTMAEVAKSYDENIEIADTNSLETLYWVFPMRPGLDAFGFVNKAAGYAGKKASTTVEANPFSAFDRIPGLKQAAQGIGALAKPIGAALGWTKQDVDASPSDFNLGVMQHFALYSMTGHDAWWIWFNRGWRVCMPTIVCLPPIYPSQLAIDKFGQTAFYIGARPPGTTPNSLFASPQQEAAGPDINPNPGASNPTDDTYPSNGGPYPAGSRPPNLASIPEDGQLTTQASTQTLADRADRQAANDPKVVKEARGGKGYKSRVKGKAAATKTIIGAAAKKTASGFKKGFTKLSNGIVSVDKFAGKYIPVMPDNGALLYGANWIAGDVLSNGLFANVIDIGAAFISEAATFGASDAITNLRYSLKVLAQGEASAKEFFAPYQGVPTYMMLTELPFTNVHPNMVINVDLERPAERLGLKSAFALGEQEVADIKAHAAAKVFYYRQPNDEQNEYFKKVKAGPLDVMTRFLAQTPASQRLENWYGSTQWFTAFLAASDTTKNSLDYTELDNVFNPFWEVRLADDTPPNEA